MWILALAIKTKNSNTHFFGSKMNEIVKLLETHR